MDRTLRLYVVAEDPLARAGLAALLAGWQDCLVLGQGDAAEALRPEMAGLEPDLVLWDLGWDPGPEVVGQLGELAGAGMVCVALLPDESMAQAAWAAGARGMLLRQADAGILVAALQAAHAGLVVVEPPLSGAIRPAFGPEPPLAEPLTPRELQVLHLLAEGLSNRAIAQRLGVSEHTAKFHVNAIMGKLEAQSRTEAAVRAARLGLILL